MFIPINDVPYNALLISSIKKVGLLQIDYNFSNGNILSEVFASEAERDAKFGSIPMIVAGG